LIPLRLTTLIRRKILDSAVDLVSEALSMHVTPLAIWTVVVPAGVTILLGLCNPPRSWTGMVGPSLPDFTIAPCVDSLLCYRSIKRPKSILQDSPQNLRYMYAFIQLNLICPTRPQVKLSFSFTKVITRYRYSASLPLSLGFNNPRNTLR
jgi:hypothetical protein